MSDPADVAFDAFKARYDADTGVGGLAESGGAARVHEFVHAWDYRSDRQAPLPMIVFESSLAMSDTTGIKRMNGVARITLVGNRDSQRTQMAKAAGRIRDLLHENASLTDAGGTWTFSTTTLIRSLNGQRTGSIATRIFEFVVRMQES